MSVIGLHNPTPVEVKVRTTLPVPVSAAVGVYCAFSKLASLNVPKPEEIHDPELEVPPHTFPANWTNEVSAQSAKLGPASI